MRQHPSCVVPYCHLRPSQLCTKPLFTSYQRPLREVLEYHIGYYPTSEFDPKPGKRITRGRGIGTSRLLTLFSSLADPSHHGRTIPPLPRRPKRLGSLPLPPLPHRSHNLRHSLHTHNHSTYLPSRQKANMVFHTHGRRRDIRNNRLRGKNNIYQ